MEKGEEKRVPSDAPKWNAEEKPGRVATWIVRGLLAAFLICVILFLREADRPWKKGVESLEEDRRVAVKHYIISGLWYGGLFNAIAAGTLLLTSPLWLRKDPPQPRRSREGKMELNPGSPNGWLFWAPVLAAVGVAAWMGVPRLSLSLWGDEEHTLRSYIHGRYEKTDQGEFVFDGNDWSRTLWAYTNPNNHILNTVLARLSLGIWKSGWDGEGLPFSEEAIRLPGFVAALGGIIVMALLLRSLGWARAGIVAAWLCALHPWFLRYATEARGYAHMLLLLPAALFFLVRLWKQPSWVGAIGLGICEFLLLWAYPGAFYALVFCNLAFLGALTWRGIRRAEAPWPALRRWAVGSTLGAMAFIWLFAPCLPQLIVYMQGERAQAGVMNLVWAKDYAGLLLTGVRWDYPDPTNPVVVTLKRIAEARPWFGIVQFAAAAALTLGFVRMVIRGGLATGYALAFIASGTFTIWHAVAVNNYLYHWYMIFSLPFALLFMALGIEVAGRLFDTREGRARLGSAMVPALALAYFAAATSPQRTLLRTLPVEQQRESVLKTRPALGFSEESTEAAITVAFARGGSQFMTVPSYDLASDYVHTAEGLREAMARAEKMQKPLYVNMAMPGLGKLIYPEIMELLQDPDVFTLLPPLFGQEDNTTRYVYRYNATAERTTEER